MGAIIWTTPFGRFPNLAPCHLGNHPKLASSPVGAGTSGRRPNLARSHLGAVSSWLVSYHIGAVSTWRRKLELDNPSNMSILLTNVHKNKDNN